VAADKGWRLDTPPAGVGTTFGVRALELLADEMLLTGEGQRNTVLNRVAFRAGQLAAAGHLDAGIAAAALTSAALTAGLDQREAAGTVTSGLSAGLKHPAHVNVRERRR
jgi:hypothetical protein